MSFITNETPVVMLTLGQLIEALKEHTKHQSSTPTRAVEKSFRFDADKKLVFGLKGIRMLFNVSHVTAQRYKDTFLKEAVIQNGRKIIVDVDKAIELFDKQSKLAQ